MTITKDLVRYRVSGLEKGPDSPIRNHRIVAKLSHPKLLEAFLSPPPQKYVTLLLEAGHITSHQAHLSQRVPMADAVTIEGDSGGHTGQGLSLAIFPALNELKRALQSRYHYEQDIFIGLGGGIGTPEAIKAAFSLGADYVMTGSINQCTIEAGTSPLVKTRLSEAAIQDFTYAPAGDLFEIGGKIQVYKKGTLFPVRAQYLFQLYQSYADISELPSPIVSRLEADYFQQSLSTIWNQIITYYSRHYPTKDIHQSHPKLKMALMFKSYFRNASFAAINGIENNQINFQIHSSPAIAACNLWLKKFNLVHWEERSVSDIALRLLNASQA